MVVYDPEIICSSAAHTESVLTALFRAEPSAERGGKGGRFDTIPPVVEKERKKCTRYLSESVKESSKQLECF